MNNLTLQKRKSSLPLEKKLEIYEFEVDENEPKTKQKKKRGPKPGGKSKVKGVVYKKVGVKSPTKNEANKKQPNKLKNALVSSVKNKILQETLSSKCCSSPLFENKRRPNEEGLRHVPIKKLKENVINLISEVASVENEENKVRSMKSRASIVKRKKGSLNKNENQMLTELDQKENLLHPEPKHYQQKDTYDRKILTPKKRTTKVENIANISRINKNATISSSTPIRKESNFYNTVEVPVLFHNAQNASPKKTANNEKPTFSAMSDDENVDKSYPENQAFDNIFHSSDRSIENKDGLSRSSFYHDSSYDCEINASTPVKYNNDTCNSSVHNCFGFDEIEEFEEPLVSPIKVMDNGVSGLSVESRYTPYKTPSKKVDTSEKKDEIPVTQVIRLLKFGTDDDNVETRSKSSSSNGTSPIFNDVEEEPKVIVQTSIINTDQLVKPVPRAPRRSYERPAYFRKINKSFEEEDSDEETHEKTVKSVAIKKKQGPSKKEQNEMQKWIKAFNSQCQEIEKFDLLVE